jgi:hypothetical protein
MIFRQGRCVQVEAYGAGRRPTTQLETMYVSLHHGRGRVEDCAPLFSDQQRCSGEALLEVKNTLEDACRATASPTRWLTSNF